MMDFSELYKHNVFPIPLTESDRDLFLVYSPLTGDIFFAKRNFLKICEEEIISS